ncbi:SDR family oxidoreductase [Nocardia wallacei]|uniref:SDR family oxidoreductase n=1 Tax=Nocardia wallacei TaxID=480035 RepID=UPI00245386F2|nr:NAD(P)H-binding protein [Nocardia wallacei]
MSILVTGARGSVGRTVIEKLLAAGESVRAASSQPGDTALPPGVEVVGFDPADPAAALDGVDRVFLYAADRGLEEFARAAKDLGVQRSRCCPRSPRPSPVTRSAIVTSRPSAPSRTPDCR